MLFVAPKIGRISYDDHIAFIQSNAGSTTSQSHLQRLITLDPFRPKQCKLPTRTYRKFLDSALRITASEITLAEQHVKPHDLINLQFTSGEPSNHGRYGLYHNLTSLRRDNGRSKSSDVDDFVSPLPNSHHFPDKAGALTTKSNIVNNGILVGDRLGLSPDDKVCCPPPLFHCFGLVLGFLASFTHGSSIIFPSDSFDATRVIESIVNKKATVLLSVPTMFIAEMEVINKTGKRPTSLRCALSAGSALSMTMEQQLRAQLGLQVVLNAYGMTETSPVSFMTSADDTLEKRMKSLGRILPHVIAKIVDVDGKTLPRGQRGELCTSGFLLQKGYFKNEEKTQAVMKRDESGVRWMHTGDEVVIDRDGYAYLTGRIKDIIIRGMSTPTLSPYRSNLITPAGGENIFPREIEDRIVEHKDISEASVVGLNNERYGETVGAFIRLCQDVTRPPSDHDIRDWVTQRLGRHKAPSHVFWVGDHGIIQDFPKTGSGKHQKHLLRDIGNKLLGNTRSVQALL